jgi:hypothetical protein
LRRGRAQICVETMMHLTCTNMPKESLKTALDKARTPARTPRPCVCSSQHQRRAPDTLAPSLTRTAPLPQVKAEGIQNILALRGDPPKGSTTFEAVAGGFSCALDLVKYIRAEYGDYFGLTVAGYPEAHPDVIKSDPEEQKQARARMRLLMSWRVCIWGAFCVDFCSVCAECSVLPLLCCACQAYAADLAYLKQKVDAGGCASLAHTPHTRAHPTHVHH